MAALPFTFTPDTTADANQVNANFRALANPPGPLGIGTTPPADAQPGVIFGNNQLVIVPRQTVTGGDQVGHLLYNAYVSTSSGTTAVFKYLTNGPAYDLSFDSNAAGKGPQMVLRFAPIGSAGGVVAFERIVNWQPGALMIDPVSIIQPAGDLVGQLLFNALYDASLNDWTYFADGAAASFIFDATSQRFAFRQAPPGTANTVIPWTLIAALNLAPPAGSTNFTLLTNNGGTITQQAVLLGAAGTGPGGAGRMLYVPN